MVYVLISLATTNRAMKDCKTIYLMGGKIKSLNIFDYP